MSDVPNHAQLAYSQEPLYKIDEANSGAWPSQGVASIPHAQYQASSNFVPTATGIHAQSIEATNYQMVGFQENNFPVNNYADTYPQQAEVPIDEAMMDDPALTDSENSENKKANDDGKKKKKGVATNAANEQELRRLYRENEGKDLHEIALQVSRDDKGPKAEKSKQIFGMLW
jgi:hypothetical protein